MPKDDARPVPPAPRSQLIVITKPEASIAPLVERIRSMHGVTLRPLFGERTLSREQTRRLRDMNRNPPDLTRFYEVVAREEDFERIISAVRTLDIVESVYRKAAADAPYLPSAVTAYSCDETACCRCCWTPPQTGDFSNRQRYLDVAPGGIGARQAWAGGARGQGVEIVDVEREWLANHEDLANYGGLLGGMPADCLRERNHGTAILGILIGTHNNRGVLGISPQARVRGYSTRTPGMAVNQIPGTAETSAAIVETTWQLTNQYDDDSSGHIVLLELQRIHPTSGANIPVEWWPDDFAAIQHATALGLVVVEAAGNGNPQTFAGADLDDPLYDVPLAIFGATWQNPFKRVGGPPDLDSGSIIVGAGVPPIGTMRADRSRLRYSNYGACVDVQGWGSEVVTTGYGCLQGGTDETKWYMGTFGGTSAASAMVAAVLACVQSRLRATGQTPLLSTAARQALQNTGSPQVADGVQYPVTQHIGPRPDLQALLAQFP
jgi:Subtilase family